MTMCSTTPLTYSQLQQLAMNAGFPSAQAPIMAQIALAESGGCPTSTNPTDNNGTQTSWGLWQISDGTHRILPGWSDPQANANMAYQKYKTQGLRAWGTYTNGAYKNMGPSTNTSGSSTPATNSALSGLPFNIGQAITSIQQTFVNAAEEIGIFLLAISIIILGVFILNSSEIKGLSKKVLA